MELARAALPTFLQISPISPLPISRTLIFLTGASVLGAFILLVVLLLNLGYLSMRITPCVSVCTLLYHLGFVLVGLRKRTTDRPSYFSTALFSAYLLTVVWLFAFILTVAVLALHGHSPYHQAAWLKLQGLHVNVHTQRVQVFLTLHETIMVGALRLKGHAIVHNEGPDPPGQVKVDAESSCVLAMNWLIQNLSTHRTQV